MKAVSGKHLCKVLERHGWRLTRINGSHHVFHRSDSALALAVPVHANRSLKTGTPRRLMKAAGLSESDL